MIFEIAMINSFYTPFFVYFRMVVGGPSAHTTLYHTVLCYIITYHMYTIPYYDIAYCTKRIRFGVPHPWFWTFCRPKGLEKAGALKIGSWPETTGRHTCKLYVCTYAYVDMFLPIFCM